MTIMTQDEFKEWYAKESVRVVGTCEYAHCGKQITALSKYTQVEGALYHRRCLEQKDLDEFSAHIDEHPILSPGSTRSNLAMVVNA